MPRILHELRVVIDSAEEFVEEAASRVSDALGAFGNRHVVHAIGARLATAEEIDAFKAQIVDLEAQIAALTAPKEEPVG